MSANNVSQSGLGVVSRTKPQMASRLDKLSNSG